MNVQYSTLIRYCWFILLAKFCQQKLYHIRDSVFPRLLENILKEYLSKKEIVEQDKICRVSNATYHAFVPPKLMWLLKSPLDL
jgi:hypothetical protein